MVIAGRRNGWEQKKLIFHQRCHAVPLYPMCLSLNIQPPQKRSCVREVILKFILSEHMLFTAQKARVFLNQSGRFTPTLLHTHLFRH